MSDGTTPRPWQVYSDESNGLDGPKYPSSEAVMIYADEDCESHPIADCSANHTCRMDWECAANAALIVRAVNAYDKMREALETILFEAERENGGWAHLKRVIAIHARGALAKAADDE